MRTTVFCDRNSSLSGPWTELRLTTDARWKYFNKYITAEISSFWCIVNLCLILILDTEGSPSTMKVVVMLLLLLPVQNIAKAFVIRNWS